jgi:ATP-dependent DNA helicase RecG
LTPDPLQGLLDALRRPLVYAAREDFAHLHKISGLEDSLRAGATRVAGEAPALAGLLAEFVRRLPAEADVDRVSKLRACLTLLQGGKRALATVALGSLRHGSGSDLTDLPGVGPKVAAALQARDVHNVADLLRLVPRRYQARSAAACLADVREDDIAVVEGEVRSAATRGFGRGRRYQVTLSDGSGVLDLVWFRLRGDYFADKFPVGATVRVSGKVRRFGSRLQIAHPELAPRSEVAANETLVPIYPEIEGLRGPRLRALIARALETHPALETLPASILAQRGFPPIGECLRALHHPPDGAATDLVAGCSTWQRRMVYEELLLLQLAVLQRRAATRSGDAAPRVLTELSMDALFPFRPTAAQRRVLAELSRDLMSGTPMRRLVQGDVGSGKTAVALTCAYGMRGAGFQSAMMVPTEVLAEQHARGAAAALSMRVALLTGSATAAERRDILARLGAGDIDLLIGTHALIQPDVGFARLGLVMIDEQHRFGVEQRAALVQNPNCHLLVMTATPIPRTLALTAYGDLDVSAVDELPAGRRPIATKLYRQKDRRSAYARLREEVEAGHQGYVVFPLVEESESEGMEDVRDATAEFDALRSGWLSGLRVGLLHGRMRGGDKDAVMYSFRAGDIDVLVATTVIEVGIDVANATVMLIEHAERFGLAQLHQLRGRVGRGAQASHCFLLCRPRVSDEAWARLTLMERSQDGFAIAEADLAARGPGDFAGARQSGMPSLTLADLARDYDLLRAARSDALALLAADPMLAGEPALRALLMKKWQAGLGLAAVG